MAAIAEGMKKETGLVEVIYKASLFSSRNLCVCYARRFSTRSVFLTQLLVEVQLFLFRYAISAEKVG
jgi:hypothetical protein